MTQAFELSYVAYEDLGTATAAADRLLGVAAFGAAPPPAFDVPGLPSVWIDMPALRGSGYCEVWRSSDRVERMALSGVSISRSEQVIFGSLQVADDEGLEAAARLAYSRVFEVVDTLGFPYLLRVWNYFAGINADVGGVERYHQFNVGRYDAFSAHSRAAGVDTPAACALGSRAGPLTVYFIAGKEKGRPIENPRQISAYRYPDRYGPRSPTFARAMLIEAAGPVVAISGTASIVGHETRHVGDSLAQVEETLDNIGELLKEAGHPLAPSPDAGEGLLLKAYLRRPDDLQVVERALGQSFGRANTIYLQADVCRSDLLVEIEGLYKPPTG